MMEEVSKSGGKSPRPITATLFSKEILGLVLLIAAVIAWGDDRDPADATEPLVVNGTPQFETLPQATLRVGTFNIHGGKGLDGVRDLDRTSELLRDLDVVALQEVHAGALGMSQDQATAIGQKLNLAALFVPAERRWWRNSYGNGLLTRIAPTGLHRIPLVTTQNRKFRMALLFNVRHDGQVVHFLAVHLDTIRDREQQLGAICDLFLSLSAPAVLMGDLNSNQESPQLERLLADASVTDFVTAITDGTANSSGIDWIITRGLRCVDSGSVPNDASDHPLVWAELQPISSLRTAEQNSSTPRTKRVGFRRLAPEKR
jgi:endonuclease/exonuclease/phosphatase family metal-dependent hydrolase